MLFLLQSVKICWFGTFFSQIANWISIFRCTMVLKDVPRQLSEINRIYSSWIPIKATKEIDSKFVLHLIFI